MCNAERDRYCKRATHTWGALQAHRPTMQFRELVNQRQSNAGSLVCSGTRALDAMKALENALLFILRNAHAGVSHREFHTVVYSFKCNSNLAVKGELESIGEKIQDDLFPHVPVHINRFIEGLAFNREIQ